MLHFVEHLIHAYGLLTVALIVGLECIGVPLPGETALLGAAIYAGTKHDLNIVAVILTAAAAAIVGRVVGYAIGRGFGYWLLLRYGSYMRITEARIKLGQYLFLRHGGKIVFIAQFVPVLRTFAGIFAGANMMPWRDFLFANVVGSVIWSVTYGYAAYALGRQFERLEGPVVIFIAVITIVGFVVGGIFVNRHEQQLLAEAERAMPGPLKLP
ncbi:MAG TPA: DedA family protein [Xanthobacteraceae bacterium]|jgi:membrane protein DedA with SNARE-associated domain|nr:DedA family protein [Xanthobacteraceae bacterium]